MFQKLCIFWFVGFMAVSASPSKLDPGLVQSLSSNSKRVANVFIRFGGNKATLSSFATKYHQNDLASREEKVADLVERLQKTAQKSQKTAQNILNVLPLASSTTSKVEVESLWISNELYIKGADASLLNRLASLPEVTEIVEERMAELIKSPPRSLKNSKLEWGIKKIEADVAWSLPEGGNNGKGVIVANIDTGVRGTHEALKGNYRGVYGWFDPITGTEIPTDDQSHGTHTMGSLAGSKGIGVAPGSQWMACKGCNIYGRCPQLALLKCGQWILCPTLPDGTGKNCSMAPSVVSNSWGMPVRDDFYQAVVSAWIAADIVPVFAAGNEGSCSTIGSPGDYPNVLTVGSTDSSDLLSYFSSQGPGREEQIKPEVTAPGSHIRSASHLFDNWYAVGSGTSMSTPHVSGAIALIRKQKPNLSVSQVIDLIIKNVDTQSLQNTNMTCGGKNSTSFPNFQYGYGRLNARKALEAAIKL